MFQISVLVGSVFLLKVRVFTNGWSLLLAVICLWSFLPMFEIGFGLVCLRWKTGLFCRSFKGQHD